MAINKAKAEIEALAASGIDINLVNMGVQPYAHVRSIMAPSPPWDRTSYDILIAIPLAYDERTGLDAFYIELPYQYGGSTHNRINGAEISYDGKTWKLISWHYTPDKGFNPKSDSIGTHIVHCKGFFLHRGATNARE